jgi:hypothetical protein
MSELYWLRRPETDMFPTYGEVIARRQAELRAEAARVRYEKRRRVRLPSIRVRAGQLLISAAVFVGGCELAALVGAARRATVLG